MRTLCLLMCYMCAVVVGEAAVSGQNESVLVRSIPSGLNVILRPFMRNEEVKVGRTPCTVEAPSGRHIIVVQDNNKTRTHFFSFTLPCEGDFVVDLTRMSPVKPEKPPVKPEKPPVKPEKPPVKPEKPPVKPEKPPVKPEKPPVKPEKSKLFIRSTPSCAGVYLGEEKLGTTPCLLTLDVGTHELILKMDGYADAVRNFVLKDTTIHKPPVVHLGHKLRSVDIIFLEEGWQIFVDGEPYLENDKPVMAPATIKVSNDAHEIKLIKGNLVVNNRINSNMKLLDLTKVKPKRIIKEGINSNSNVGNPKKLFDGIIEKGNGIFSIRPGWVTIDFGKKRKLTSFSIYPYQASDDAICTPTRFVLFGSHDGKTYIRIKEFRDSVKDSIQPTRFELSRPIFVRYIKYEFSEVTQDNVGLRKRIALSEITFP
jgi:hypothetical protein